jgi:hypothetical protein
VSQSYSVHKSPAGERAAARTGDVLLTYRPDFYNRLVEFGQRRRYPGRPDLTRWSHAALVVDEQGELVEALSDGVPQAHARILSGTPTSSTSLSVRTSTSTTGYKSPGSPRRRSG